VKKHAGPEQVFGEEWFNEEMPAELPPVPVGYVERVRDWVAENPSVTALVRKAIREQLHNFMYLEGPGPDEYQRFSEGIPRATNAVIWWLAHNQDQAVRLANDVLHNIDDRADEGAAALHDWAASNPGFATVLRGLTRARLLHLIFQTARISESDEGDDREIHPRATGQLRIWTRHNPYKAQGIFDLVRGIQIEESLLERAPNEEPLLEEGTQRASTPLDFDSEEGPPTRQQEDAVLRDGDAPSPELTEECAAHRRTGGTCFFSDCYQWRGATQCVRGRCVCEEGQCSASDSIRSGFCTNPFEWQRLHLN